VAASLRVEPGEDVIARRKLMFANGSRSESPPRFSPHRHLRRHPDGRAGVRTALTPVSDRGPRLYLRPHRRRPHIRRSTLFEPETLDLQPDEWIVQILRTSYSTEGTSIYALETICAASRHIFPIGQVAGIDEF
jgi:GntR family transcriptional regulator